MNQNRSLVCSETAVDPAVALCQPTIRRRDPIGLIRSTSGWRTLCASGEAIVPQVMDTLGAIRELAEY